MVKQNGHPGPLILALFSFGIVYWQYKSRSEIPWQVAVASVAILAVAGAAALFLPVALFPFNAGFFPAWCGWSLLIGIPAIAWTYWNYD